jgi:serine/threonine protein kinase
VPIIPNLLQVYRKDPLPFTIDKCIGSGNQGQVYSLKDNPDQVVKLSMLYDDFTGLSLEEEFDKLQKIYQHIIDNPHKSLVKVYSFGELYRGKMEIFEWEHNYVIYNAIMQKLNTLSENEQKVFKTVCDIYNKALEARPIATILDELEEWFDVDKGRVLTFYNSLSSLDIDNKDVKPQNIMKDNEGQYKLIDYDLAIIKEKKDDEN